jgi:hypothetical protein
MMTRAEQILQEYIDRRTRYNLLLIEIDDITEELVDRLNFPYVSCSKMSDMPRSKTSKFHSSTEILALLGDKVSKSIAIEIIRQGKELERFQNRLIEILEEGEYYLIAKRYFERDIHGKYYTWAQIAGFYTRQYKLDYVDKQTIKWRIKRKILPRLEKML